MKYKLHSFFYADPSPASRPCSQEGCALAGEFKAPRSRAQLKEYLWFCLEHVKAYNQRWNYYNGMSEQEIEHERRLDVTWQRPTWPFAQRPFHPSFFENKETLFSDLFSKEEKTPHAAEPPSSLKNPEHLQALALMDLPYPFTQKELKQRYIEFAKKYHPDMNGGSQETEERLKEINLAYEILKKLLKEKRYS